ncbi:MAG: hypothetical protein JSV91_04115, partial [Phycisphaerales bacterium]
MLLHAMSRVWDTHSTLGAVAVAASAVLTATAPAGELPVGGQAAEDGQTFELRYTATFSQDDLVFGESMGFDTVKLEGGDFLNVPGEPMLPAVGLRIALPEGMAVTGVEVVQSTSAELEGEYSLFPAQPPQPISTKAAPGELVAPEADVYASADAYPGRLVEFTRQNDLAGQAMAGLRFFPLQYAPAEGKLTFHNSIEVVIRGQSGYRCGDYLPQNASDRQRESYEQMVRGLVANPEDVRLSTSDDPSSAGRGVGPGDYDFVIITQSSWEDNFQPLADWKTKRGMPTAIVTTSWIYNDGGYSGDNQTKIRAFVQDARTNWGTMYFLLGGDTTVIPYNIKYLLGDNLANDTYYGDYDSDYLCEVHVGRASVRYESHVTNFIGKVLTYEQNPPLTDYAKTATFVGFDLTSYGSHEGENLKTDIKNYYLPSGWTYRSEYDSETGYHKYDVITYLNQGNNLVNHADHSDTYQMGTGLTNHGQYLSNSDMTNLNNGDYQSILYSLGCWAAAYDATTCIGEAFVQDTNGGGLAFVGNSRYGWYYQYQDVGLSFTFDRYFFRSLFPQGYYVLGDCFSDHKNDVYISDVYLQYIFTELNLLGDPTVPIWTEDPLALTVIHDDTLNLGQSTDFQVEVRSGGSGVGSATVCLWLEGDLYEIGTTDAGGVATFPGLTPGTTGTMYVTACKHNYLPEESEATVIEGSDCPEDLNGDLMVDIDDVFEVLAHWGEGAGMYDVNDDGTVDIDDLF